MAYQLNKDPNGAENHAETDPKVVQELAIELPVEEEPQAVTQSPQIPVFEAITPKPVESSGTPENTEIAETEPASPSAPTSKPESQPTPEHPGNEVSTKNEPVQTEPAPAPVAVPNRNLARALWNKALLAIQSRKRKRLEKILTLFEKHKEITNDIVEKLLHVSDATASRYLSQLEREGKIKQNGETGRGVTYSKI